MHKNILAVLLLSFILFSCKEKKENNSQKTEYIGLIEIKGSGFEPSWDILISQKNNKKFTFELTTMMGEKRTSGNLTLKNDFNKKEKYTNIFTGLNNNGEQISIVYQNGSCFNMTGNDTGGILTIEWSNRKLKGCGKLND